MNTRNDILELLYTLKIQYSSDVTLHSPMSNLFALSRNLIDCIVTHVVCFTTCKQLNS